MVDFSRAEVVRRGRRLLLLSLLLLLVCAAAFYLFVFPALVATGVLPLTFGSIAFAMFLYVQLWMIILEYIYTSAAGLYGFRREHIFPFLGLRKPRSRGGPKRISQLIILTISSYILAIYGFAVAYCFAFTLDPHSFNTRLSLFDFFYFSVVTAATVGYGDIFPQSAAAKALVIAEIWFNYLFAVFVLGILANEAASRAKEVKGSSNGDEDADSKDPT